MNSSSSLIAPDERAQCYQNLLYIKPDFLSQRLDLLFSNLPTLEEFLNLFEQSQSSSASSTWDHSEKLLLQLLVLSTNPECISDQNHFDWNKVQRLMPKYRSTQELYYKFQSYYKPSLARQPWSTFEDQTLFNIIMSSNQSPKKKWNQIAAQYNLVSNSEVKRNAKQCRERWNNKLDPSINRDPMTAAEELHFLKLLLSNGRKWADLALKLSALTNFKRRTEFGLKHKYKQLLKYQGYSPQHLSTQKLKVSSVWSQSQTNMILYRMEYLNKLEHRKKTREYQVLPLTQTDLEVLELVIVRNGNLKRICKDDL